MKTSISMSPYQPTSGLGWVDFSDTDKQKVMRVIEMLKPDGTVDELGVGVVRNSLSDAMFSGITTIMTRAKYYFIIPRILHSYITLKHKPESVREYVRIQENEIMNELTKKYLDVGTLLDEGIIGYTIALDNLKLSKSRYKEVERKPSTIYWNGIRTYGIYKGQLSLTNFLDLIENRKSNKITTGYLAEDRETGDDRDSEHDGFFPFSLSDYEKDWRKDLSISLTPDEGDFLRQRIIDTQKKKLLGQVLSNKQRVKEFLKAKYFCDLCDMPFVSQLSAETQTIIYAARDFWQIMEGAHIRYNIILHSRHGSGKFMEECNVKWSDWVKKMSKFDWKKFNKEILWQITDAHHSKVKSFTKRFINTWMNEISGGNYNTSPLDVLVERQEKDNKQGRSKLKLDNDEKYSGWVGIDGMEYRLRNAKIIVNDIATVTGMKDA
jgi:hypothetical protein